MNLLGEELNLSHNWVLILTWYLLVFLDAWQDSQLQIPRQTHKVGFVMRVLYTFIIGYSIYGAHILLGFWMIKQGAIFYFIFNPVYNFFRFVIPTKSDALKHWTWSMLFYVGTTAWWDIKLYQLTHGPLKWLGMSTSMFLAFISVIDVTLAHVLFYWAHWKLG